MNQLESFKKRKEYLLCVDSDGCVIDGMTIKHKECFGPALIEIWPFAKYEKEILEYWNRINLYSTTRGINRFKGLLKTLIYINGRGYSKVNIKELERWVETTDELSNTSLKNEIKKTKVEVLEKALLWSNKVNEKIKNLSDEKKLSYSGVEECFAKIRNYADIAVVSSANKKAVEKEWEYNKLTEYVDVLMTQECGSKTFCIQQLLKLGYKKDKVIMIGDAPGDIESAKKCGILYYPILVDKETKSWKRFQNVVIDKFIDGSYKADGMKEYENEFNNNLASPI